ncbi:MAG: transposase family protein [Anaerolineales bacterium]
MNETQVAIPLGIPDVRVLQTSVSAPGAIVITIESTKGGTRCRKCGKWLTKLHGQEEWVTIRHLSVFGRPTFLRYRPHRYQCPDCNGDPIIQRLEWHDGVGFIVS